MHHLIGKKFGRLEVVGYVQDYVTKAGNIVSRWKCLCDCQLDIPEEDRKYSYIVTYDLLNEKVKSCGCLHKEIVSVHGESRTRLNRIWVDMRSRCYNSNAKDYKNYGARGIKVCDEWKDSFINFREWAINNGYTDELTIERINVNGDYSPENCKWATKKEQENNKRTNIYDYYKGEKLTMMQFADRINKSFGAVRHKFVEKNMPFEDIAKYFENQDALCVDITTNNNSVSYSIQNNKRHSDIITKIQRLLKNEVLSSKDAILRNYLTVQKQYRPCYVLSNKAINILNK